MGVIDRRKHDVDVMERVLGRARDPLGDIDPYTEVFNLHAETWLAGTATSAVQVTVGSIEGEPDTRSRRLEVLKERPARRD